jgi:hypothetical protein
MAKRAQRDIELFKTRIESDLASRANAIEITPSLD